MSSLVEYVDGARAAPNSDRAKLEVSGNVRLEIMRDYAEGGVDYILIGALTRSAPAADVAFRKE